MAMQGPFKIQFGQAFPFGALIASELTKTNDFDRSTRDNPVQAR